MILALLATAAFWGEAIAKPHSVLIIHSYHRELPWVQQCDQGISVVLSDSCLLNFVYLDTKRIPESEFPVRTKAAMTEVRRLDPDLVMLGDDNALRMLGPAIAEIPKPVVFFGINNNPREYFDELPENVTGILERVPLFPLIRHLARILPEAQKALVLTDSSPTSKAVIYTTFAQRRMVTVDKIEVEYLIASDWNEWRRAVKEQTTHDLIAIPLFHALKDNTGRHIPTEEVIRWTSKNSPVPVFAYQDYAVGDDGVVGSYVIFGKTHGRYAALLARDILEGKEPHVPPAYMDQGGKFFFNEKQLKRFGLTLPPEIRERTIFR
ncbi:MAG: ABC transporter substrate binding protein [Desulfovibrionaceae bacterium]